MILTFFNIDFFYFPYNTLKLNITPYTNIVLGNGQAFSGNPGNRNLIVLYGATTKSIPAQTTPYKIIVMC